MVVESEEALAAGGLTLHYGVRWAVPLYELYVRGQLILGGISDRDMRENRTYW